MKLSIIIPIYHTQATLKRCIKSILIQPITNYEIILVDDGSPDDCPHICDEYAKLYQHISVIHKSNGGLSDARNAGINKANGEYITFIDSDDTLQEDTLRQLMAELIKYSHIDILEYPVLERYGHPHRQHLLSFIPHEYNNSIEYWLQEKAYNHTYAWNKIYKRDLFKHICFPKGKTFEDVLTLPYIIGLIPINEISLPINIRVTNVGKYIYHWNTKGITANAKYEDWHNLYQGNGKTLEYIFQELEERKELLKKYSSSLQDFMTQILNILLDLYELSGKFEPNPPLIHYVEKLSKTVRITSYKLKLLNILGYHTLCRLNKFIHRIYRHH